MTPDRQDFWRRVALELESRGVNVRTYGSCAWCGLEWGRVYALDFHGDCCTDSAGHHCQPGKTYLWYDVSDNDRRVLELPPDDVLAVANHFQLMYLREAAR